MSVLRALRGIGGEYEVQRVLGAVGTITYTFSVPILVATRVIERVDITAFCLAYPSGLAACIGATAGAIALKDRSVATAKVVERTGAVPVPPPAGPAVPAEPLEGSQALGETAPTP